MHLSRLQGTITAGPTPRNATFHGLVLLLVCTLFAGGASAAHADLPVHEGETMTLATLNLAHGRGTSMNQMLTRTPANSLAGSTRSASIQSRPS